MSDKTVQMVSHRGPDEFASCECTVDEHVVRFFHHRLSILDLSANGSQPMESADGHGIIIFNGEIYNHAELRNAINDIDFRGHSDTETLVNLCRNAGIKKCLPWLNGIFAFAYLDIKEKKLYLARDRFGVKPLYYYLNNNEFVFSSELRPILDVTGEKLEAGAIAAALSLRHVPAPKTFYKNIFKLEPGQCIEIALLENLSISTYHFADFRRISTSADKTREQLVTEYGQLLEKAVEKQLLSDVEVGVLLSGGIDSSLIAAIAKSKLKTLKSFTVGFDDKQLDERSAASQTAACLHTDHYSVEVKFDNFLQEFENIVNIVEEPVDSGSLFSMYALSKLVSSKVKVVLSGQGADEPLGGYRKYKALPAIDLLAQASPLHGFFRFCSRNIRHQDIRRVLSTAGTPDPLHAYFEFNSLFGSHTLYKLLNMEGRNYISSEYYKTLNSFHDDLQSRRNLPDKRSDLYPYLDTRTKLSETLLKYTDKITMHFSLECRVPMLDNDLVAFIESLPREDKFGLLNSKIIHKTFARQYLPDAIINRKKLAFHAPSSHYFRTHSSEIREWFINNSNRLFWMMFNKNKIMALVDEHQRSGKREKELILIMSILFLTANEKRTLLPA